MQERTDNRCEEKWWFLSCHGWLPELDKEPEKVLLRSEETGAAPTLLYLNKNHRGKKGIYYLTTEIYPHRYTDNPEGEWQVKVFAADVPDGDFLPVEGNPVLRGQRACLFQHVFHGRFYGHHCTWKPRSAGSWKKLRHRCLRG